MAHGIPARLTSSEGRKFAFTVGAAFLALTALVWWRQKPTLMMVFGALGGVLLLLGIVAPTRLGPIQRAWMGLAHLISKVTTPIFMGIIYRMRRRGPNEPSRGGRPEKRGVDRRLA